MDRKQAKEAVLFLGIAAVIMVSAVWCYETYFVHKIQDTPKTVETDGSVSGTFYGTVRWMQYREQQLPAMA